MTCKTDWASHWDSAKSTAEQWKNSAKEKLDQAEDAAEKHFDNAKGKVDQIVNQALRW